MSDILSGVRILELGVAWAELIVHQEPGAIL